MSDKLSRVIQKEINKRGWSRNETAKKCGISYETLLRILEGGGNPQRDTLIKIKNNLNVRAEDLL